MTKAPHQFDIHVGARLKLARSLVRMSQEKLGETLGITFQQIQKYEKGTNRICASRLAQISFALGRPISWFFEGIPGVDEATPDSAGFSSAQQDLLDLVKTGNGPRLIRLYLEADPVQQTAIVNVAQAIQDALSREQAETGKPTAA